MLGISPRTLQNHVRAKQLPSRKIGRRTVVLVRDLELFLCKDHPSPKPVADKFRDEVSAACDESTAAPSPGIAGDVEGLGKKR